MTLALALLLAQEPVITGDRSIVSQCEVSDDAEYGYTQENPIKVGGTPMYGPARQRRFLQALAGPAGQPLTFKRRGSLAPTADGIIIDLYEVTYPGLEKPIELYLDLYRWDPPRAPQGLLCASEIGLAPPDAAPPPGPPPGGPPRMPPAPAGPRPPLLAWDRVVSHAIDWGQKEETPPIPLDEAAPLRYGVAFDPFTRIARVTRAAEAAGKRIAPALFAGIRSAETLLVAFPLDCGGRLVRPKSINVTAQGGRPLTTVPGIIEGGALARALPAFTAPEGAIGVLLRASTLPAGHVTIAYDGPACPPEASTATLDVRWTSSPGTPPVSLPWPEGVEAPPGTSVAVTVHALVNHEGVAQDIRVADGPEAFHAAAIETVARMRHGVISINGVVSRLPRPTGHTFFFRR
ncbi:MAG TPA: hypothetical protein VMN81_03820 [Vicinamibacterales bacterium]|nr:hypothetical protein [Vicinamibacterales bacterium]